MIANPKESIIALSFLITLAMTLVTKKFTNQSRMKELKEIQKACQIKLKDAKGNPEEASKIQKEMMACSMELMKHSFKPMIFTFIPLILIFGFANGNLAYYPITPGEQFSIAVITEKDVMGNIIIEVPQKISVVGELEKALIIEGGEKKVDFNLIGESEGNYLIDFKYNDEKVSKNVLISKLKYDEVSKKYKDKSIKEIKINYIKTGPFGYSWLFLYIGVSIVSSIILRKALKVV